MEITERDLFIDKVKMTAHRYYMTLKVMSFLQPEYLCPKSNIYITLEKGAIKIHKELLDLVGEYGIGFMVDSKSIDYFIKNSVR